jgi:hypothetical protein
MELKRPGVEIQAQNLRYGVTMLLKVSAARLAGVLRQSAGRGGDAINEA